MRSTSLCPATYVRWQHGTARIHSRCCSNRPISLNRRVHSSKPAAKGFCCGLVRKQADERTPQGCYEFCCSVNRGTMGANSLPNTVIRQRRNCYLNPGSSAPESSTLTTRLPSCPSIAQRDKNRVSGLDMTDTVSFHRPCSAATDHVSNILASCSSLLYALRILRCHGIPVTSLPYMISFVLPSSRSWPTAHHRGPVRVLPMLYKDSYNNDLY